MKRRNVAAKWTGCTPALRGDCAQRDGAELRAEKLTSVAQPTRRALVHRVRATRRSRQDFERQTLDGERRVVVVPPQLAQDFGARGRHVVPGELGGPIEGRRQLRDASQPRSVELDVERPHGRVVLLFVALARRMKDEHPRPARATPPPVALAVRPAEVQTEVRVLVRMPRKARPRCVMRLDEHEPSDLAPHLGAAEESPARQAPAPPVEPSYAARHFRATLGLRLLVGAAVLVLIAVHGLGLVRALVLHVGDAVLVVVGIRAAVLVLEPVLVLGLVRGTCPSRRGCRRCRCRDRGSRRRPGSRPCPRARRGTCRWRRRCRPSSSVGAHALRAAVPARAAARWGS